MRIAVTGSAGTGKSSLSGARGRALGLPVVPEGMREYLERSGVKLHSLGHEGLKALVLALWEERGPAEEQPGFVADRCSVDFAAFWLYYRFEADPRTEALQRAFRERAGRYERVIVLPYGAIPLRADGVRSANRWTQLHYQLLLEGLLSRLVSPERVLRVPPSLAGLEERLSWVMARLPGGG